MKYNYLLALILLLVPTAIFAEYQPLVGIPGIDVGSDFNAYINALYKLSIALAALLAVIKIIVAGAKWMLTDLISSKEEAKKDIEGAILGLLIIIAAVIILETINPQLTKTNVFVAPVSDVDNSAILENNQVKGCELENGIWNNTTYQCDEKTVPLTPEKEPACEKVDGSSTEYNCDKAKAECEAKGGVASPAKSLNSDTILKFKINCTPKSDV